MSFPTRTLRALLAPTEPKTGIVTRVNGQTVHIATSQGLHTATTTAALAVGDKARLEGGGVEGGGGYATVLPMNDLLWPLMPLGRNRIEIA